MENENIVIGRDHPLFPRLQAAVTVILDRIMQDLPVVTHMEGQAGPVNDVQVEEFRQHQRKDLEDILLSPGEYRFEFWYYPTRKEVLMAKLRRDRKSLHPSISHNTWEQLLLREFVLGRMP